MQDDGVFRWIGYDNGVLVERHQIQLSADEVERREFARKNLRDRFEYGIAVGGWLRYGAWSTADACLLLTGFPLQPYARDADLTDGAHTGREVAYQRVVSIAKTWPDMDGGTPEQWIEWARRLDLDIAPALVNPPQPVSMKPMIADIAGATFTRLQAALEAFDPANPPRSKKAFMGVLETKGCDTREQEVFAKLAAEHYGHSWG